MLVLGRSLGQRILIRCPDGSAVWVSLLAVRPDRVKLGFEAPDGVRIDREEVAAEKYGRTPDPAPIAGYYYAAQPAAPPGGQS